MNTIRDRESLLRGLDRELLLAADDKDRTSAIKAEIERVKALPPHPASKSDVQTPAERDAARGYAYLAALRKERGRAEAGRYKEIDAEIDRVENALTDPKPVVERAREVPKTDRTTANRA